jgi:hypothetical protein
MADRIQFPSAIHAIRLINDNIVSNLLVGRTSYIRLPPLYLHAYSVVYETGESPVSENLYAPDESTSLSPGVRIFSK